MASVAEVRVDDVDVDDEMSSSDFIDICVDVVQDDMPKTMPAPDVGSENHNKRVLAKNPNQMNLKQLSPANWDPCHGCF